MLNDSFFGHNLSYIVCSRDKNANDSFLVIIFLI